MSSLIQQDELIEVFQKQSAKLIQENLLANKLIDENLL